MNRDAIRDFLQRWVIDTVAVMVAAHIVPGIRYDTFGGLIVASLLLGVCNSILRPLLLLLSLPLVILTLGLFSWLINAALLYFVGSLVTAFHVRDFWAAFWGALVISLASVVLNTLTGSGGSRLRLRMRRRRGGGGRPPGDGEGPVIDV